MRSSIASSRSCSAADSRRLDEREHLDLVELVDAEDAAGVAAGGAGLAAEAGGEAAVAQRQRLGGEDLAGVEAGQRHLRGAGEEELVLGDLVDLVAVAGQEAGPLQRLLADQHRRHHRLVPLGPDQLDREADQGQLQHHQVALEVGEAGAGEPRGGLHLDQAAARRRSRGGRAARSRTRSAPRPRAGRPRPPRSARPAPRGRAGWGARRRCGRARPRPSRVLPCGSRSSPLGLRP